MLEALKFFPGPWTQGESDTRISIVSAPVRDRAHRRLRRRTVAYIQLAPGDQAAADLVLAAPDLAEAALALLRDGRWIDGSFVYTPKTRHVGSSPDAPFHARPDDDAIAALRQALPPGHYRGDGAAVGEAA